MSICIDHAKVKETPAPASDEGSSGTPEIVASEENLVKPVNRRDMTSLAQKQSLPITPHASTLVQSAVSQQTVGREQEQAPISNDVYSFSKNESGGSSSEMEDINLLSWCMAFAQRNDDVT